MLMDWQMPGMDGVEASRRMREAVGKESGIILLTAHRWEDIEEEARKAGVDGFLSKPLFADAVMEEFRRAAGRRNLPEKAKPCRADLNGRRILLAKDIQVNAEIMIMVLDMRGMKADLAENGRIALQRYEASPEGFYDAILMDLRMPEMDGLEATRRIRALARPDAARVPIIALTVNDFDEDVQRSLQAGLNAHLTKPVEPEALFSTLENLIRD